MDQEDITKAANTTENSQTSLATLDETKQVDFLVKQLSADLDKLNEEMKEQRAMVRDAYASDSRYQEIANRLSDLQKQKKAIQQELSATTGVRQAKQQLQEMINHKKALEQKLSEYLRQYVEKFNSKTVEDTHGTLKEIVTYYKLIRSKSTN